MSTKSKSTVGFMVRIKEGHSLSGGIQSQLRQLKLNNLYDGQFVNLTEELISMFCFYTVKLLLTLYFSY